MQASRDIDRLIEIMAALRTPGTGCPWDLEQDFGSIAPYTLEEAYEVADAIARSDLADLREELGDLLLQVVYHARMAQEQGAFDFGDVVQTITEKLLRRHPHVFGQERGLTAEAVAKLWDRIKAEEKASKPKPDEGNATALAGVPIALPALPRFEAAAESRKGWLRLERSDGRAGENSRGGGRNRCGLTCGQARKCGRRSRGSLVCSGQSRASSRRGSGIHSAQH